MLIKLNRKTKYKEPTFRERKRICKLLFYHYQLCDKFKESVSFDNSCHPDEYFINKNGKAIKQVEVLDLDNTDTKLTYQTPLYVEYEISNYYKLVGKNNIYFREL